MSVCCFLERPLLEVVYLAEALRAKAGSIFDNRQLEVERELQLIYETSEEDFLAKRIRAHDGCLGIRRR